MKRDGLGLKGRTVNSWSLEGKLGKIGKDFTGGAMAISICEGEGEEKEEK